MSSEEEIKESYIPWKTPLMYGKSVSLVSLVDDVKSNVLTIIFQDNGDKHRRVKFTFGTNIYRNIDELYRTSDSVNSTGSWTVVVENSRWLSEFYERESHMKIVEPDMKHYQVITEFDVIDILTSGTPDVEEIEPEEDFYGRAPVYYLPDDKEKVDVALAPYRKDEDEK